MHSFFHIIPQKSLQRVRIRRMIASAEGGTARFPTEQVKKLRAARNPPSTPPLGDLHEPTTDTTMKHYLITLIDPRTKIHHTVPIETEGGSFGEIISATEQEGSMTFQRWSDMTVRSIEQIDEDEYEDYSRNS